MQTPNTKKVTTGDTRRVLTSVVKRETTLTASSGPKIVVKWETMWEGIDSQEVGLEAAIL